MSARRAVGRDDLPAALKPVVTAAGFDLEGLSVTPVGRRRVVRVVVDRDGGSPLDAIAELSRELSRTLDAGDLLGTQPYVLEVTSPGVDRPLTVPRHWRRAIGHLVTVTRTDGSTVTGRVVAGGDDAADLAVPDLVDDVVPVRVPYVQVRRAVVQVELNRRGAADGDLDPDDVDDVDDVDDRDDGGDDAAGPDGQR